MIDFPSLEQHHDKRRSPRRETRLRAYILVESESFAVSIENYSVNGLYVSFDRERPSPDRLTTWVGMSGRIDPAQSAVSALSAELDSVNSIEPLEARIVHAEPVGLGLQVPPLPPGWLALLERTAAGTGDETASEPMSAHREYEPLLQRCISVYSAFLRTFTRDVLTRSATRLGAVEGSDARAASDARFDQARAALTTQGSQVVERVVAEAASRTLAAPEVGESRDKSPAVNELRLMHADELEEFLLLSAVIKRIEEHVGVALDQFEMRYTRLVGAATNAKQDPFAPEKTLRSLQRALSQLNLSPQSARVVYAEIEAVASARYPDLLRDLNLVLAAVEAGPRKVRARDGRRLPSQLLRDDALPDEATRTLIAGLREPLSPARESRVPRAVLEVIEALTSPAVGAHGTGDAATPDSPGLAPTGESATLAELLAVIDRLPTSAGGAFEQASTSEITALLRDGTAETGAPRHIGAEHEAVLDTTARLFSAASSDFVPRSDVESMIKRLERTLLKLSLRDGEFPSSPAHPARKVVNLIEQYNFAANDAGKLTDAKLRNNLDSLVTRICEQADRNPAVFSVVQHSLEDDLESLRRERRQRVDRIIEALESRDRVRVIRSQVDQALAGRLAGRRIPRVLIRLLDDVWRQHLVLTGLRHGTVSEDWNAALLLIERTLAVSAVDADDDDAVAIRAELNRELVATLADAVIDHTLREKLLRDLHALMVDARPELTADVIEAPRFEAAASVSATNPAITGLKLGEWWDMKVEQQWVPVQLVWKSVSTGYCGFINRSASNRLEMTSADFGRQLGAGTARPRESLDTPLLDRTEGALLTQAYSASIARTDRDGSSGSLNRKGFMKRLRELESTTAGGEHHVVGMLEFDQFRAIASTCGVDAVETLARTLNERIQKSLPRDCVHAVFREDSVAVLMPHLSRTAGARAMAQLLSKVADFHFMSGQHSFSIGVSVGVAGFGDGQCGADEVLRRVDAACLTAKAAGRNRLQEYEPSNAELRSEETLLAWAGRADALLASDALYLRAQMVMPMGADPSALPYYEILLGIESTWGSNAQPYDFILALERLGRSHEIDLWVLRNAFQWVSDNWTIMDSIAGLAINLSVPSLRHPDVMRFLRQELPRSNFPAHQIVFEITETAAIRDFEAAEQFITDIRRYGCGFSLDDFGSGFTSYAHLKRLSIDTMKIDGSYVKDVLTSPSDQAIVKSMTDIGHTLGMKVVAEWVESPQILEKLVEYGVDYAQGYAVHKPVRLSRLVAAPEAPAA